MKIIIMGVQGSGKGTHSKYVANHFSIPTISTGDLFRANIANGTELGMLAKTFIDKGNLVPDEVTVNMLKNRINEDDCKNGFILDGFPRNKSQAEELEKFANIDLVLYFDLPFDVAIERMMGRLTCKNCSAIYNTKDYFKSSCEKCDGELYVRDDDKEEAIKARLKNYEEKTMPLMHYYEDKLRKLDMNDSIEVNRIKIAKVLEEFDDKN